jgi:hypothetical protein
MSEAAQKPSPRVNDSYWFALSEELVTKSSSRHEEAAAKLQSMLLWLWGIYTTYAALGTALSGKALPLWAILVIASASAALIAVYWGTVWVQTPVAVEFDSRSPDDIRAAWAQILEVRHRRFIATMAGLVVAAFMVAAALIVASTVKEEKAAASELSAAIANTRHGRAVAVLAVVDKGVTATVRIAPQPPRQRCRPWSVRFSLRPQAPCRPISS